MNEVATLEAWLAKSLHVAEAQKIPLPTIVVQLLIVQLVRWLSWYCHTCIASGQVCLEPASGEHRVASFALRCKPKLLEPFDHRIRWCTLMLGFDVCHEITNAMEVGIAFATRGITNGATHHIHLAPTIVLTVVDEPVYAALELLCTLGVAPSLV